MLVALALRAGSLGYLRLVAWRRLFGIGRFTLAPLSLSLPLALAQIPLAKIDAVLAGTVVNALLPAGFAVS